MQKITFYKAYDGKTFDSYSDCMNYEDEMINEVFKTFNKVKNICDNHCIDCSYCPFVTKKDECLLMAKMTSEEDETTLKTPNYWDFKDKAE